MPWKTVGPQGNDGNFFIAICRLPELYATYSFGSVSVVLPSSENLVQSTRRGITLKKLIKIDRRRKEEVLWQ